MEVVALGELLIDFTENGNSAQGNPLMEANPGGAPCNLLAMLSKLGHKVGFIGKIGDDIFGTQLEKAVKEVGIDTRGLIKDNEVNTTLAFVHTLDGGQREFSFYRNPGADMMLREDEVDPSLIKEAKIFHFGTLSMTHESCRAATKKALQIAKDSGKIISFDPNIREPLWDDLELMREQILYGMSQCDILKISDNEIQWLTGEEDYDKGVRWIKERYDISLILVSLGPDGSMAFSSDKRVVVQPFLQEATIETTGAGDTFGGCVLHYVLEHGLREYSEEELSEMLTFANAAASIVTTRKGALRVMPNNDEIQELLREEKKYEYGTEENKRFLQQMGEELLTFGRRFPSPGGGAYYLGDDGTPWKERPRETWITCRMAHVYSIGHMLGYPECGALADQAIHGLLGELKDSTNGGWFAGITRDGQPLPLKQCYAHAFVILAATSGVLANRKGADSLLEEALKVYDKYFWDFETGLARDTWDTGFASLDDYRGVNANMHTVEAFLAVADAVEKEEYRTRAGGIIDKIIAFAKDNNWRIPEHYTKDWEVDLDCNKDNPLDPFKPYGATPGHGIEWARLILQWCNSTFVEKESKKECYIQAARKLYDTAIKDGWYADGEPGIVYTTDWDGKPVSRDRMHWTLAEAINTSSLLYRMSGEVTYKDDYSKFMKYLDETVLDHKLGSWYHQLDGNNRVTGTVWPGKSDLYHAFQATLIPYESASISIAKAVATNGNNPS